MMDWPVLLTAFLLGLFSSAHCVGMCGGIMGALSMAVPAGAVGRRLFILCSYNVGRLFSYVLMGALVGLFSQQITASGGAVGLRWLAGLLLIAMGLYLANWWRGLTYLESTGRYLWAYLQPLGKRVMPVDNPLKGLLLGALWGWLPCGLVYSALAYGMAQGHWTRSALVMLAFGIGTLPSLLLAGIAAQQLADILQRRQLRWMMAVSIILFGIWTLWGGTGGHAHHHADPAGASSVAPMEEHHHPPDEPAEPEHGHHHHH